MRAQFRQAGRYAVFAAWFFKDAFFRYRRRLLAIFTANACGIGLQALAVLAAYQYGKALEAGKPIEVGGVALDPRTSIALLATAAVTTFLLAVVSALLVMRARVEGDRLSFDYGEYCSQRIHALMSRPLVGADAEHAADYTMERLFDLTRRDATYCGTVLRSLIYVLPHVGTVAVAGAALLVIDFPLTLAVFAILGIAALFMRRISIRAAAQRALAREHGPEMAKEWRALRERVARSPLPLSLGDPTLRRALGQGGIARVRLANVAQRSAMEGGKLVAQVAMGCALFLVLVVQGGATLSQASNWSALLVYVAALSFFGGSIARVSRVLVSINRFYPPLAAHARFVEAAERESGTGVVDEAQAYRLKAPALDDGERSALALRAGTRAAVVYPAELTRFSMMVLARAFESLDAGEGRRAIALPWFAGRDAALDGGSLRENFGFPAACSRDDVHAEFTALRAEGLVALPASLDQPLDRAEREALTPRAIFLLWALSGLLNRRSALALEHDALAALDAPVREALLERAAQGIVLVGHGVDRAGVVGDCGETAVIVAGRERVYGWAPLAAFRARGPEVSRAMARAATDMSAARVAAGDEQLDDLE